LHGHLKPLGHIARTRRTQRYDRSV
jgi:hypothetical protein